MAEPANTEDVQAANIALYRRLIEDGVSIGRLETIDEVLAPDVEMPTVEGVAEPTPAGLKQSNQASRAAFPDMRVTIEEVFAFGDWVAARLTWTGTNTGEFMGQPPTGNRVSITEIEIVRCRDGKIVGVWQVSDRASLVSQLSS